MIVSVDTLKAMNEFQNMEQNVLKRKLNSAEKLIRAYTNNNFQNRAVRFRAASDGTMLIADLAGKTVLPFLLVGDTVEISQSQVNDGLCVVSEIDEVGIRVDTQLFPIDFNLVTKVEYPDDVKEGVINMLMWDVENRQKVGIKAETLSRHSVTYYDQDANNQVMGYPVSLMGFLSPYIKARF